MTTKKVFNILQISFSLGWGGREMFPITLSQKLLARGHNLKLIAHPKGMLFKQANLLQIPTIPLQTHKYIDMKAIFSLSNIICRENIQIIHSHFAQDLWLIVPAAILSSQKPKIIFTRHMKSHYNKKDIFHKFIYKYVDKVIAISELVKECLLDSHPLPANKIITIYHGLDLTRYNLMKYDGKKIKEEFKIENKTKIVGIVGRLNPGKGQEYFLQTAKLVLDCYSEVIFLIVGEDIGAKGYKDYLINLSKELGIPDKVIFTGHRDDIPEVMASLDVFVLTSIEEAFGLVVIEAMAMSTPVVAFDSGAIREIITTPESGILVPLNNIHKLADEIISLLKNPSKAKEIGKEGRKIVVERFNLDLNITQTERVYEEALQFRP